MVPTVSVPKPTVIRLKFKGPGVLPCPTPETGTLCGLPVPFETTVTLAFSVPDMEGVKVSVTLQLVRLRVCGLSGQVLPTTEKSAALVPVIVMLEIVTAAVPVALDIFRVRVELVVPTFCVGKVTDVGLKVKIWFTAWPVPERPTVWGVPTALSVMTSDAVRVPAAAGVNEM